MASLRNGFYAHSLHWLLGPWRETGVITVPADGPVSWTAREDTARAAALILASNGAYEGPTTPTASSAPTFEEIAAIASQLTGRTIGLVVMAQEEWLAAQPNEFAAHLVLGMYQAAQNGFSAGVNPLLGTLLGREPQTVRDVLARPISH